MKKFATVFIVLIVLLMIFLILGPLYVIDEGEQAVIVQMGRLTTVVTEAGLHAKIPFVDEVIRYPKRIMAWDGEQKSMLTKEKQYIWVDVTARWKISDPRKFYESISTLEAAYQKLAEIIDSEVRTVVAENDFRETVRNSNLILERPESSSGFEGNVALEQLPAAIESEGSREPIVKGRRQLAAEILERSRRMVPEYGIDLIDVVTRQIRYNDDLTQSVYSRMIKERNQIAQARRSEGEGKKAEWLGRMSNEKMSILSDAYSKAETIRGTADAEASAIYAEAYNRDRDFFDFWRAIESYRVTMPNFDKTLSTDMDYFRYLYSPRGR
ncbi:MAG: protease modulator HflC [Treponema sp.]|jgi:membrane protease subunit HflC|nr:protease modulator HflC [Treponema sp.]